MKTKPGLFAAIQDMVVIVKEHLSGWYILLGLLFLSVLLSGCDKNDEVLPALDAESTRQAVLGKWSIEKIDSQLCHTGNCNTKRYKGSKQDYFEFRADSAFIVRHAGPDTVHQEAFKLEYTPGASFTMSSFRWIGRFKVKELLPGRLVLESSFKGRDPNAVFTDIYFLYR